MASINFQRIWQINTNLKDHIIKKIMLTDFVGDWERAVQTLGPSGDR